MKLTAAGFAQIMMLFGVTEELGKNILVKLKWHYGRKQWICALC